MRFRRSLDYIIDAHGVALLRNGDVWMTKVTGVGCSADGAHRRIRGGSIRCVARNHGGDGLTGRGRGSRGGRTRALGAGVGTYATKRLDVTDNLDEQTFVQRLNISFNRMEA